MATPALPTILKPQPINKTVSRLRVRNTRLQDLFGLGLPAWEGEPANPSARNVVPQSGRNFSYDVFNDTRKVARGRTPGASSSTSAPQAVGNVMGSYPRIFDKIPLSYEKIHNLRPIGGPAGNIDTAGMAYIKRQERFAKQQIVNMREFQVAAMLRGSYTYTQSGDDLFHDFSGGGVTINFQVPATNLTRLDMLGAGNIISATWANAATNILTDISGVETAFQILHGLPLYGIIINSVMLNYILDNTQVKARAGSTNTPFEEYREIDGTNDFFIRLKGKPELKIFVINEALDLGTTPTTTKLIADTQVTFIPEPGPEWIEYWEGSEIVVEKTNGVTAERKGAYFWADLEHDPAGYELRTVHNGIPALFVPNCIATATAVF